MQQKMIKLLLLFAFVVPCHTAAVSNKELSDLNEKLNYSLVYIDDSARDSMMALGDLLPDNWSSTFKDLRQDFEDGATVAPYDSVDTVVSECLAACEMLTHDQLRPIQADLEDYQQALHAGHVHINALENDDADHMQIKKT